VNAFSGVFVFFLDLKVGYGFVLTGSHMNITTSKTIRRHRTEVGNDRWGVKCWFATWSLTGRLCPDLHRRSQIYFVGCNSYRRAIVR